MRHVPCDSCTLLPVGTPREADVRSRWFREPVIAAADKVLAHRLYLPSLGEFDAGPDICWRTDYQSGYPWPDDPAPGIRTSAFAGSDVRTVWEINRCQHFPLLGLAWRATGERGYLEEFQRQANGWIEANPPGRGPNWISPMEASIRALNWLVALDLFHDGAEAIGELRLRMLESLAIHGRFIRGNLEVRATPGGHPANNNHYFSNLLGLLAAGEALVKSPEGRAWRDWSSRRIQREFLRQVHAEGTSFESSLPYHRLMIEMGVLAALVLAGSGRPVRRDVLARLHGGLRLMEHAVQPDGSLPLLGDSDDGRLLPLAGYFHPRNLHQDRWGRWRRLLFHEGAEIEDPSDACLVGRLLDAGCLPLSRIEEEPPSLLQAYPRAGWFFYRRDGDYLGISAGEVGTEFTGNHKHNDLLSVVYWRAGQEVLVDPGTGCYRRDPRLRDRLRSTAAHNTVALDGEEQNRFYPGALFGLRPDAFPILRHWRRECGTVSFSAGHTGYHRLAEGVTHDRTILFDEADAVLVIHDCLRPLNGADGASHDFSSAFHLPERFAGARLDRQSLLEPHALPAEAIRAGLNGELATLRCVADVVPASGRPVRFQVWSSVPVCLVLEEDLVSRAYGQTAPASTLRIAGASALPVRITVTILG